MDHERIVDLYERHARNFDRDRGRSLQEKAWLDRFIELLRSGRTVLDVGCGMGEPLARYLIEQGCRVVGIDSSGSMIAMCVERFPESEWLVRDMRTFELGRRFDGILAWDSFFHLCEDDQRAMFPRFAAHARHGAPLMFTAGHVSGEAIGCYRGEPLYHASLDPAEYEQLLVANGFSVQAYKAQDQDCGEHTVWLARFDGPEAVYHNGSFER
jgi:SAM-dependent methyltransferase